MTNPQASTASDTPVTLIGLGPMGLFLGHALVDAGHPVTVWNRTPGKADALVAKGAHRADGVAEAVAASPVTLLCLNDYATAYAVLAGAEEALAGRALVNLNSGTPREAEQAAAWAERIGVAYLDGAIMVPPPLIGKPGSVLLYSGPRDVFDRHRSALDALGDSRFLGAEPGLAVLYNAALLEMMYTTVNGWLHATALVGSSGVKPTEFAELAFGWFVPTVLNSEGFLAQAADLDRAAYPGELGTLEMNLNALDHIARASEERGVRADQPRLLRAIAERGVALGHGHRNYYALLEVFKRADVPV
jgi:3-hydroxyisobutyrate dehydrogenase-like beta-hydroxyacid dehydrogenase